MSSSRTLWGRSTNGADCYLYALSNDKLRAELTNAGAALVSLQTTDRQGQLGHVVVNGGSCEAYLTNPSSLGATAGRFANRIGKGRFQLDGKSYSLATNNGPNHLHGGPTGFAHRLWEGEAAADSVTFRYVSTNGEEGYPGEVTAAIRYRLENNQLILEYSVHSDAPTVINLTNHAYWNLSGKGSILEDELQLFADQFLEIDKDVLPTGKILDVAGTPYDFRQSQEIGKRIAETPCGYDNCFVIKGWDGTLRPAARVTDRHSGRVMEVLTTEPGVQLYTSNHFDGSAKSAGYQKHEAFCLECQHFPDSPNQPKFPSTVLRPGEEYRQTTVHRFDIEK